MIKKDQPTIFGNHVVAGISSVQDGNMKKKGFPEADQPAIEKARHDFLGVFGISLDQTVLVSLTYELDDFAKYAVVTKSQAGEGMTKTSSQETDALATQEKSLALFLPIADCVGAILYDPKHEALMVSHLGRHSTEQFGGRKSVEYMEKQFQSKPEDLLVWLSPSPSRESYPVYAFENRGLQEIVISQMVGAGVQRANIEANPVDTSTDRNYFSHSEFKKGNRDEDGRYAIVAMLK